MRGVEGRDDEEAGLGEDCAHKPDAEDTRTHPVNNTHKVDNIHKEDT